MRRLALIGALTGAVLTASCTSSTARQRAAPPPAGSTAAGPSATSTAPTPTVSSPAPRTPSPRPTASAKPSAPTTRKPDPISVEALIQRDYDGRDLKVGRLLDDAGEYKRYLVTYRSEDLLISGVMNVPDGKGPFPVLVLAHGYIEPDSYQPGQGMRREQDYLARQGYVVLHTDYRGHAGSDDDDDVDYELRLPYAVDVVNAVLAVKESGLDYLDGDRVGLFGRSMGGNVVLNALVAQPRLVDAAVVYASTSSLAADNYETFSDDDRALRRRIDRGYGLPEDSPGFWRAASPRGYFDRVTEPVQLHHGTDDDTCPPEWSEKTLDALRDADKEAELFRYPGEGHTFYSQWQRSIERTERFFDEELD